MKLGFIGLGRMGGNLVVQLSEKGHEFVVYNRTRETTDAFVEEHTKHRKNITPVYLVTELVAQLEPPRVVWLMIKSGKPVDDMIASLVEHLDEGDTVIDGGNSFYKDSMRRKSELAKHGIGFLDVGTSGGMSGAREGACMMIGGDKDAFLRVEDVFRDACVRDGYGYMGSSGAGHFVKMVHNGIEYGMMAAIAEGMNAVQEHANLFDTDIDTAARVYANGSIIESRLMSWTIAGMHRPYFHDLLGSVPKGETEDEMRALTKLSPMPILEASINEREKTRTTPTYAGKLVAAMRHEFGGHAFTHDDTTPKKS